MALTTKQKAFVQEYIKDLNATQAYIRAGYSDNNGVARVQSSRLLANPNIQAELTSAMNAREKRTQVTSDRVLLEIARLAFNDPRKAFDQEGVLLPVQQWPDEVAAAIQSIKVTEQRTEDGIVTQLKEVKFWDKGKQIELAGKHLGMFTDKVDYTGNVNLTLDKFDAKL
jgi:phage terminase small subunit